MAEMADLHPLRFLTSVYVTFVVVYEQHVSNSRARDVLEVLCLTMPSYVLSFSKPRRRGTFGYHHASNVPEPVLADRREHYDAVE